MSLPREEVVVGGYRPYVLGPPNTRGSRARTYVNWIPEGLVTSHVAALSREIERREANGTLVPKIVRGPRPKRLYRRKAER